MGVCQPWGHGRTHHRPANTTKVREMHGGGSQARGPGHRVRSRIIGCGYQRKGSGCAHSCHPHGTGGAIGVQPEINGGAARGPEGVSLVPGHKRPADQPGEQPPAKRPAIRMGQHQALPAGLCWAHTRELAGELHHRQQEHLHAARALAALLVATLEDQQLAVNARTEAAGRALHLRWWQRTGCPAQGRPTDVSCLAQHTIGDYHARYLRSYRTGSAQEAKKVTQWLANGHRAALFHNRQGAAAVEVRANQWTIVYWGDSPWGGHRHK